MITSEKLHSYMAAGIDNAHWYEASRDSAARWCKANDVDLNTFLSVVAILSPRVQVVRNIRLAKQWVMEDKNPSGIMGQRVRALEIFHGSGKVSGTKINAFRDSLMLKPGAVCIDIHMSRIFGFDGGELMSETKKYRTLREKSQRIVRRLAHRYGMTSYGVQACLWCGYLKTEKGYSADRFGPMDFSD